MSLTRGAFVDKVYSIAEKHGGSVTSGLRSRSRNKIVGGKPASRHISGYALDVVCDNALGERRFIEDCQLEGFGVAEEGDHIHVQTKGPVGKVNG
jgi:uncharacterized protein YcbK (DUF882 family)